VFRIFDPVYIKKNYFFVCVVQQPSPSLGDVITEISRAHTIRHTNTVDGTPLDE